MNKKQIAKQAMQYGAQQTSDNLARQQAFQRGAEWMQSSLKQAYQICYKPVNGGIYLSPQLYADKEQAAGMAPRFMTEIIRTTDVIASDHDELAVMPIKINH